jgi:iron complex outermembrane recepter protein
MRTRAMTGAILAVLAGAAWAQDPPKPEKPALQDLADLSLEELMRIEVTSASRKEQRLMDVPAAVTVIRGEDLRRIGATNIPEALRMVPGMNVARIDSSRWAVSSRGFRDRFANNLQVLVDGRSVYSPLFSGVFWEMQDTMFEDVDRIEVIRGPGGSVWGSNAVNGVINIITKKASDTQGGLATVGGGSHERAFGAARYGVQAGDVAIRVFGKGFGREEMHHGEDEWWQSRAGARADWAPSKATTVTFLAESFAGRSGGEHTFFGIAGPPFLKTTHRTYDEHGTHALARVEHRVSDTSLVSFQGSVTHGGFETDYFGEERTTGDLDLTHRFQLLPGHDLVWGAGYRLTGDDLNNTLTVQFSPEKETLYQVSTFVQDEIRLIEDSLSLTLGSRFEYNTFTRFEYMPSARLLLKASDHHVIWAAASRAVRTPSRADRDVRLNVAGMPAPPVETWIALVGNDDTRAEAVIAYEAGYRLQPADTLSFDLSLFVNEYDHLQTGEVGTGTPFFEGSHVVVPGPFDDKMDGVTYGAELAATWHVLPEWRLYGAFTYIRMNLHPDDDSVQPDTEDKATPRSQVYLRSSVDFLGGSVTWDTMARYVARTIAEDVDSYIELDLRVGWHVAKGMELAVVGQNLVHNHHFETDTSGLGEAATEIERGAYLMVTWQF